MSFPVTGGSGIRIGPLTPRAGTGRNGGPPEPAHLGPPPAIGQNKHSWYDGGPQLPQGNYASSINAAAPISQSRAKSLSNVQNPFSYNGTSSGGRSRSALSRALTDPARFQVGRQIDQFNTQQRQQAQQSQAQDILSQRQNTLDRFRMEVMKEIFDDDTWTRFDQGRRDLTAHYQREASNATASAMAGMFGGIGGALLGLI
jgi:hypothetical protein